VHMRKPCVCVAQRESVLCLRTGIEREEVVVLFTHEAFAESTNAHMRSNLLFSHAVLGCLGV
jgi:hypothetical protein